VVKRVVWTLFLIVLALGVGLWLGANPRSASASLDRAYASAQFSRTLFPFKVAFVIGLGTVILCTIGGLGWAVVRWVLRRADTVYPDRSGLYPLREERLGGSKVFHDPNRTLTGTTIYAVGGQRLSVQHTLPGGHPAFQQQVTGQAQAAQALRAAVSGASPLPTAQGFPAGLFERQPARSLPEVRELGYEPSHIERLLLQDGDAFGVERPA
jgi:hypothetical protein